MDDMTLAGITYVTQNDGAISMRARRTLTQGDMTGGGVPLAAVSDWLLERVARSLARRLPMHFTWGYDKRELEVRVVIMTPERYKELVEAEHRLRSLDD